MKKLFQNDFIRFLLGALLGILISLAIINWSPKPEEAAIPLQSNQYSVLSLTNRYSIFIAPLTLPAPFIQHEVNFGCSSDAEITGCYRTMDKINAGRLYLITIMALYGGLIFLYVPNTWDKGVKDLTQAIFFIIAVIAVFLPFYWLFPAIIQWNSNNWITPAILLLLMYVPTGLFGIYQIILEKLKKKPLLIKRIGWMMLFATYMLSIYLWLLLDVANGF